jgi:hypothetical protein
MRIDRELPWTTPRRSWYDHVTPPWGEPVAYRWRLADRTGAPVPESVALVDAAVPVLDALRRGETVPELDRRRFAKALRQSAFADRRRGHLYSKGSDGVGETFRLARAAEGALRTAAVLLELRGVRFRD